MPPSPSASPRSRRLRPETGREPPGGLDRFPIVAHSHLPWSSAFPRPHQTHGKLAERHPVLFVERPVFSAAVPDDQIRVRHPTPQLAVAQPVLSSRSRSALAVESRVRAALRRSRLAEELPRSVHWLYGPEMAGRLDLFADPLAVVYDCVEDCGDGAAAAERRLLRRADLVFAAGHALFRSRFAAHPRVRLVESGVDFDHFHGVARDAPPADLERIPAPRAGFAGVLDGRVDFDLVRRFAAERPGLSVVLLGPVDGIARTRLPRGPNIFHLGPRPYEERPAYLAGFGVGVLPYRTDAQNAGFEPPHLLEHLAAGRPVVSTPLPEVVRRYADVIAVADRDRFAAAVDEALASGPRAAERGLERARAATWTRVVGEMEILVARAVQRRVRAPRLPGAFNASRAG